MVTDWNDIPLTEYYLPESEVRKRIKTVFDTSAKSGEKHQAARDLRDQCIAYLEVDDAGSMPTCLTHYLSKMLELEYAKLLIPPKPRQERDDKIPLRIRRDAAIYSRVLTHQRAQQKTNAKNAREKNKKGGKKPRRGSVLQQPPNELNYDSVSAYFEEQGVAISEASVGRAVHEFKPLLVVLEATHGLQTIPTAQDIRQALQHYKGKIAAGDFDLVDALTAEALISSIPAKWLE
ncbi:hypothetical protein [Haliea sp. E17]|uniref:hypothetical protein n=1 Tax=Haliea sp. E17 TaxID=3401576 RepID=UPI003AAE7A80